MLSNLSPSLSSSRLFLYQESDNHFCILVKSDYALEGAAQNKIQNLFAQHFLLVHVR